MTTRKILRNLAALSLSSLALSGCYVISTIGPEGQPAYYPATPSAAVAAAVALNARLYPANDLATQTGVVTGTVTNMLNGKGRFQLNYGSELLSGESTRVSGDDRRGVASAYGPNGSFMNCEYQMSNARQGAGTCMFSNGAKYRLHIGS